MIYLTANTQIMIATQPADFRNGIDGFVARCRNQLEAEPRSGVLFVFLNRNKTMLRTLAYDGTGFWLMTKRLSKGKFKGWPNGHEPLSPVAAKQLRALIDRNDPNWMKA